MLTLKEHSHSLLQEYQSCNTLPCPDLKKTTPWTPWTPVNISDNGGHYEQRFRYTCKARIPDPSLLEVGRQRIEMRYCSSDGSTGCSTDGECRVGKTSGLHSAVSASLTTSCRLFALLQVSYWPPVCRRRTTQSRPGLNFCFALFPVQRTVGKCGPIICTAAEWFENFVTCQEFWSADSGFCTAEGEICQPPLFLTVLAPHNKNAVATVRWMENME